MTESKCRDFKLLEFYRKKNPQKCFIKYKMYNRKRRVATVLLLNLLYNKTKPLWDLFTTREKACMYNVANLKHSGGRELCMTTAQLNRKLW